MPKKSKSGTEIVPFGHVEVNAAMQVDLKSMVSRMIEEGVKEALSSQGAEFQPFFGSKEIAYEIKRKQSVHEQHKFTYFFEDWGCMICGTRKAPHCSLGMCGRCFNRTGLRIRDSLRKRNKPPKDPAQPSFMDLVRMAKDALAPAVRVLAIESKKPRRRK
jgi:hypothetical protein